MPQLLGGSTWLTPGYGHLNLKASLCWEGFSSVQSLSHVQLLATPWIAVQQAPLSM